MGLHDPAYPKPSSEHLEHDGLTKLELGALTIGGPMWVHFLVAKNCDPFAGTVNDSVRLAAEILTECERREKADA